MTQKRLRVSIAVVMLVAAALFVVGTRIEKSVHAETSNLAPVATGSSGESAGHVEGGANNTTETFMGINPDYNGAVAGGVVIAVVLAAAVVFLRSRWVFGVVGAAAIAFAALDVREALHQMQLSHGSLTALAWSIAALHAAAAVLSGTGFVRSRVA